MFFPSGNAEEFCDHVFRTFDMDKNGYIDFKVGTLSTLINYIIHVSQCGQGNDINKRRGSKIFLCEGGVESA